MFYVNNLRQHNYEIKYNDVIEINNKTMTFYRAKSIGNVSEIRQQFSGLINNTIAQLMKIVK